MKIWKWFLKIILIFLVIGLFLLQSQSIKKSILEGLLNQSFKNSSFCIEAQGIRGLFPFEFSVDSLVLKEKDRTLGILSHVSATWSLPHLAYKKIHFHLLKERELEGTLTYVVHKHAFFMTMEGKGIPFGKGFLTSVEVDLPQLDLIQGRVALTFQDGSHPVLLSLHLEETPDNLLHFKDISMAGKLIQGTAKATVNFQKKTWEGQGQVFINDLSPYGGWVQKQISGAVHFKFHKTNESVLQGEGELTNFSYGDFAGNSLKAHLEAKDVQDAKVQILGEHVVLNGILLRSLTGFAHLITEKADFDFSGQGDSQISFHLQGGVNFPTLHFPKTRLTFQKMRLDHPLHHVLLKQPVIIEWNDQGIESSKLDLVTGEGMISVRALKIANHLSGDILIQKLPLRLLQIINPKWHLKGEFFGKGNLQGTKESPSLSLSLEGRKFQWFKSPEELGHPALEGNLLSAVNITKDLVEWQMKWKSSSQNLISQGKFFLRNGTLDLSDKFEASLKGHTDLRLCSLLIPDDHLIKGKAQVDLQFTGSVKAPYIKGKFSLTHGMYENLPYGTLIKDIKIRGIASGTSLTFSHIIGQDGAKGTVKGEGTLHFSNLADPVALIRLTLDQMIVVQNDELFGKTTGFLQLKGHLRDLKNETHITGKVSLDPLEVRLDEHEEKVKMIHLLEKKKDGTYQTHAEYQDQKKSEKGSSFVPLDISVHSQNQIYLRGYGLDSRWSGDLRVCGFITDPLLEGDLSLTQGNLDLMGKNIKLIQGRILYAKETPNEPLLSIKGSREMGEITAMFSIEGYASNPKINFSSSPALAQEEILSRLLFGRSLESISVTQSLLLADALGRFKGQKGLNFTDQIRSIFGLDTVEFKEQRDEDEDQFKSSHQLVSVGKRISDKIYLSVDQPVNGDEETKAVVQLDITPSLKVEADVGGQTNGGLGFSWIKKY